MTRLIQFSNNATSRLAANLSAVGLSISLTPGDGSKFPVLTGSQVFFGTLVKADGTKEVVKVTARSTDTLTIVRAAEPVAGVQTAFAFSAGDKFELRMTAGSLASELDRLDAAAFLETVTKTANYTIVETDISKLIKTDTTAGNVTITLPQISTLTGSFEVQISKSTGDANTVTVARSGADTINGLTSYSLSAQYQCVWLVADLVANTWTAITSASATNRVKDTFTGSGTAGPFTLSGDPGSKNNTDVYVGGVYQQKGTYTVTGTQLTLGGTVGAGVFIECMWSQPVSIGTPSDGTVTPQKLADDTKSAIQSQTWTSFSTDGTSTAYTLTPSPAISAYIVGQSFWVTFHTASGPSPTLQISGVATPPSLVRQNSAGAYVNIAAGEIPINHRSRVTLLSATQALVEYMPPASGDTLNTTRIDVASAATVNLTSSAPSTRHIQITGTTAITAFTVAVGLTYFIRFAASLTLTNNASIVTQTGANIVTQAGDTCVLRATAANTVEVLSYKSVAQPTLGTAVNTTSGTAIDFTGIPSWVKKITLVFNGVSTNGTSNPLVQIGSGAVQTTGYVGASSNLAGAALTSSNYTTGFGIRVSDQAVAILSGALTLTLISSGVWIASGSFARSDTASTGVTGGSVTLSGTLDRLRLTTVNGTDTFDAGSVNILYE
jgi:hypothetical protein